MATTIPKQAKRFTQLQLIATDFNASGGETADADGVTNPTVTYEAFYNEHEQTTQSGFAQYLSVPLPTTQFAAVSVQGNLMLQNDPGGQRSRQFYHYATVSGGEVSNNIDYIDYISEWFSNTGGFAIQVNDGLVFSLPFALISSIPKSIYTVQGIVKIISS